MSQLDADAGLRDAQQGSLTRTRSALQSTNQKTNRTAVLLRTNSIMLTCSQLNAR